jgi:hypothetical protein
MLRTLFERRIMPNSIYSRVLSSLHLDRFSTDEAQKLYIWISTRQLFDNDPPADYRELLSAFDAQFGNESFAYRGMKTLLERAADKAARS